jgi:hypothetical protein
MQQIFSFDSPKSPRIGGGQARLPSLAGVAILIGGL